MEIGRHNCAPKELITTHSSCPDTCNDNSVFRFSAVVFCIIVIDGFHELLILFQILVKQKKFVNIIFVRFCLNYRELR